MRKAREIVDRSAAVSRGVDRTLTCSTNLRGGLLGYMFQKRRVNSKLMTVGCTLLLDLCKEHAAVR